MSRPERIQHTIDLASIEIPAEHLGGDRDARPTRCGRPCDLLSGLTRRAREVRTVHRRRERGNDLLNRRKFGNTSLDVPAVAMGCAPLGDMPDTFLYSVPEDEAIATVKAALASPFDYIDTAALYGDGVSERRVGLALKELGGLPDGAVLQTKAGRNPIDNDYSGETVKRRFERSLGVARCRPSRCRFSARCRMDHLRQLRCPRAVRSRCCVAIRNRACSTISGWHRAQTMSSFSTSKPACSTRSSPTIATHY